MNTSLKRQRIALILPLLALGLSGCGGLGDRPELGQVSGTVTLDGQPLAGVVVVFSPDQGRPSRGKTNQDGQFELSYLHKTPGAKVGRHRVEIAPNEEGEEEDAEETLNGGEETTDAQTPRKNRPVKIPARYNTKTELEADVQPGLNQYNFRLESKQSAST